MPLLSKTIPRPLHLRRRPRAATARGWDAGIIQTGGDGTHKIAGLPEEAHWGVDIMPLMGHRGRPPSGDIEPPGGFDDALKAFKDAFTRWHATVPADVWRENLEHKRTGLSAGSSAGCSVKHRKRDRERGNGEGKLRSFRN